jgi:endonuclease III related protein
LLRGNWEDEIRAYYKALFNAWGAQHWWPGHTRFEVIVGAYLTQNTAWSNVEKALANLRAARKLSLAGVRNLRPAELEKLIRPSGYFRQKAKRLKIFVTFLDKRYGGSLIKMFAQPTNVLREQLLELNGVGPETADSILLYAGNHPVFVVDAYTRRILSRHGILPEDADYQEIRQLFERSLVAFADPLNLPLGARSFSSRGAKRPAGFLGTAHSPSKMSAQQRTAVAQVFNEMHGLLVGVGKHFCRNPRPHCEGCPLQSFLPAVGLQAETAKQAAGGR